MSKELTDAQVEAKLAAVKGILFDVVSELGNELQVAVDGPKSAARPNEDVLQYCSAISNVREVGWLQDKKSPEVYHYRPMESTNYSPIDLMVRQTNQIHAISQLEARPTHQFRQLFNQAFSTEQETQARAIKDTYNQYVKRAKQLEERVKTETGPALTATSATSGKQIEITNLLKFDHPDVWKAKELNIKLIDNDKPTAKLPHSLIAMAEVSGVQDENGFPVWERLGTVSVASVKEHNLRAGLTLNRAQIELIPGVDKSQVKAIFKEANQYLEAVNAQTPEDQKGAIASALWHVCHTKNENVSNFKKASVAFNTYPAQVLAQLESLQLTELSVVGTHQPTNEHLGHNWSGERVSIEVVLETDSNHPNYGKRVIAIEGKQLGPFQQDSPQLPIGTKAEASIVSPPGANVMATTPKGNSIKITQLKNYDWAERTWSGESAIINIGFKDNPNPRQPSIPVALVEGRVLGAIAKESADKLREHGILQPGMGLIAILSSTPATTAYLKVDPDSVSYPEVWTRDKDKDALLPPTSNSLPVVEVETVTGVWSQPVGGDDTRIQGHGEAGILKQDSPLSLISPSEHQSQPTTDEYTAIAVTATTGQAPAKGKVQTPEPAQSTIPPRPDWERKIITAALKSLDTNPANAKAETKVAVFGGKYAAVYTVKDQTLQILDARGDRGTLYKAQKGQSAEISNFSEQEKAAFLTQNTTQKASMER